jgi:hypothetical protein
VAWMLPALPKLTDQRSIRTVLLLFHGCTHHGMDWFTYPEERIVVNAALRLNYAVVSFTSQDRDSGCWSGELPASQNAELHMVATAYSQLINTIASQAVAAGWTWNSDEMKVIALGGSSGGTFVSILPHALSLAGIAMYVSPGHPEVIAPPSRSSSLCRTSVQNVVFVYMPRDTAWASQSAMEHAERVLSSSECGKTVTVHAVAPKPITVELLVDRIAVIQATPTLAHTIVAALPLDHGGYLTQDPRRISVETIVKLAANKHLPSAHVDVLVLTAHVREILSMCYGTRCFVLHVVAPCMARVSCAFCSQLCTSTPAKAFTKCYGNL